MLGRSEEFTVLVPPLPGVGVVRVDLFKYKIIPLYKYGDPSTPVERLVGVVPVERTHSYSPKKFDVG